ncbi:hypothetical protein BKA61DRAFT_261374 [Leptodontidium sp. MPI-SDFR-AT-0119]|nr:hypothetical protein BKA61DRAFT_261374 [Leptodontidium sp. MPI-SDFR-AT-0119]
MYGIATRTLCLQLLCTLESQPSSNFLAQSGKVFPSITAALPHPPHPHPKRPNKIHVRNPANHGITHTFRHRSTPRTSSPGKAVTD